MPGNTPYQAFEAFVGPLAALGCVAQVTLQCSPHGKTEVLPADVDTDHRLFVNNDIYINLRGSRRLALLVRMRYKIIEDALLRSLLRWTKTKARRQWWVAGPVWSTGRLCFCGSFGRKLSPAFRVLWG
ncbi:MAG TPA: hypothetical protein VLJ59_13780 [Mycobacteriales bacterium]|nr:hypothetical protein [Mycobacteriales bacterium]